MRFLRLFIPFLLALAVGIGLSLRLTGLPVLVELEHRLFWFPERSDRGKVFIDRGDPADFKITPIAFSPSAGIPPQDTFVLDAEAFDIFGNDPLDPSQWAYLLNQARQKGATSVIVAAPLSWEDAGEIPILALEHELSQFSYSVLGLTGEKTGEGAALPDYLEASVIARDSWILKDLPEIDQLIQPPSVRGSIYGVAKIREIKIQEEARGLRIPLLVRWGNAVLPSIELACVIAKQGLKASDVRIEPTGHLRIGESGPIVQIDSGGFARFTAYAPPSLSASTLLAGDSAPSEVLILPAEGNRNLSQLAHTISHLQEHLPESKAPYQRWESRIEIAALLVLAILLLSRSFWVVLPVVAAYFLSPFLAHQWLVATPMIGTMLTFLVFAPSKKSLRDSGPLREEPEIELPSEPKADAPAKRSREATIIAKPPIREILKGPAKKRVLEQKRKPTQTRRKHRKR